MGFTLYAMKYVKGLNFHSSYSSFYRLIEDIIQTELDMIWFDKIVVDYEEIQELLEKLEEWMKTPRSEEFFKNHKVLDREYVEDFMKFLDKCECFCQEKQ